ncbi:hypothetical protein AB0478_46195 [Streptomyces sp. NPDC051917]|uniref:hypothetical protein n=1 Tax=Streptomyces sp. NPDC051917 TaxID=3154754 RepID=UPI003455CAED
MKAWRSLRAILLTALVPAALLTAPAPAHAAPTGADLAYRWAPIHYQDTSSAYYTADHTSPVNDGDWSTLNNWDHLDAYAGQLKGTAYYSVVETSTHWYIIYAFYNPRDWKDYPLDVVSHENDMEDVLEVVHKDGSAYGKLQAAVTQAHNNYYSYLPSGSPFTANRETVDGTLLMQSYDGAPHPAVFQEARGHGMYNWDGSSFPGGDGIVYRPSRTGGTVPTGGNDRSAAYQLVDMFSSGGLWERRSANPPYASWGTFAGDNGEANAAHTPWAWDDGDDGSDLQDGSIAPDPAYLISQYFANTAPLSLTYTRNAYRS